MDARAEVEAALAFVARRQGRPDLPELVWVQVLSLELGWMTPSQARAYIERARRASLLAAPAGTEGVLRTTFATVGRDLPLGYRPDPDAEPGTAAPDGFAVWLDRVVQRTGRSREHILGDVAALQRTMGGYLDAEAAVLWLARRNGIDVKDAAAAALTARLATAPGR